MALPPHTFAVEPGRLTYALLAARDGRYELRHHRGVELPAGTFQEGLLGGPVRDPAAFGEHLVELLAGAPAPPREASLVLPDAWLRLTFSEIGELPHRPAERDEVLRWKLKRLVPFRIDELRVAGVEVRALPDQEEPRRVLLGFALESLVAGLEKAFEEHGIRIGLVSNASLLAAQALAAGFAGTDLAGLALIGEEGYTLIFLRDGEPVLHRFKSSQRDLLIRAQASVVRRDLRLTRGFLAEHFPDSAVDRILLLGEEDALASWEEWLEEAFACRPQHLAREQLPIVGELPATGWRRFLPLLGAVSGAVA